METRLERLYRRLAQAAFTLALELVKELRVRCDDPQHEIQQLEIERQLRALETEQ